MKLSRFVGIFFLFVLVSCKPFQDLSLKSVEGFYFKKISKEGIDAELKLKLQNPNTVGFTIYPSEFDIIFSGIRLGKAKLDKKVKIKGNSEQDYTFNLQSNLADLNLLDIVKLLNADNIGKIEIKGDLKVGKFLFRRSYPINYTDKVKIFR
jgi:LEA14-like dessication related protein